ncbi:hypothetical protein BCV72DRAFT_332747 [Rhizopus microsporus var. microsporus]|uniref:Uncharacterized protein n=1 Tax=Rhizopus microsporus var. microsporus TaxID=86635 RepID=A0A1X0RFQ3_RHIZD|nr:hypothetical protein BCV72DRAFT_332747 [Rhizopus microsporus var. microsporus]
MNSPDGKNNIHASVPNARIGFVAFSQLHKKSQLMSIQFLFENGKGSVIDECDRPEPMDYIYLVQLPWESEKEMEATQMEKETKPSDGVIMRETLVKRNYTHYSDLDKVRFFKLLFEKCLSVAAATKQLEIHVRTAQKWVKQYEKVPDSIFEKQRKIGRPNILHEEHRRTFSSALMRILLSF